MKFLIIVLLGFTNICHSMERWSERIKELVLPETQAVSRTIRSIDEFIPKKTLNRLICGHHLTPTHPEQDQKKYHYKALTLYNAQRVIFESSLCAVHQPLNRCRTLPRSQINDCLTRTRCLSARSYGVAVVSDVYRDDCGNIYRAYAVNQYITPESMHDLVSRGRSIQKVAGTQFREYEAGKIWTVPASSFQAIEVLE